MGIKGRFFIGAVILVAIIAGLYQIAAAIAPVLLLLGALSALLGFFCTILGLSEGERGPTYLGLSGMIFMVVCCGLLMPSLAWLIPSTLAMLVCLYISFTSDAWC